MLREASRMTDGKRCEIELFDGKKLSILVQPRLLSGELLDIAVSHFGLHEKEFFGIWFLDSTKQKRWLRTEKRVLDHNFSKGTSPIKMTFGVRLYVPSITYLKEAKTVEIFYLQAVRLISQGILECDLKTLFLLAAYVMQETNGDYISHLSNSESITRNDFKNLNILPERAFQSHPSIDECVDKISVHYKRMSGLPRGDAIVNFLSIVERLSLYGIHSFIAKDKNEEHVKLGISHRGVGQYNLDDGNATKELYTWSRIENIFYRDKKFSLEIRNLSRSGSSHSVNSLGRYSTIRQRHGQGMDVISWYVANSSDCREMWSLSVGYHQLYIKHRDLQRDENPRTLKNIARELTQSSSSLALSMDSEFSFNSCSEHTEDAYLQVVAALKSRKEMLEQLLIEREIQLTYLCGRESDLMKRLEEHDNTIGSSSNFKDTSVGATFEFSKDFLHSSDCENEIEKLKRDLQIQNQIVMAAKRLSVEKTVSRKIRKERKLYYKKTLAKLKTMEKNLQYLAKKDPRSINDEQNSLSTKEYERNDIQLQRSFSTDAVENMLSENTLSQNSSSSVGDQHMPFLQRSFSNMHPFSSSQSSKVNKDNYFNDINSSQRKNRAGKYLFGEFGNSGIYSNVLRSNAQNLRQTSANIHASSSLTLIADSPSSIGHSYSKANDSPECGYRDKSTVLYDSCLGVGDLTSAYDGLTSEFDRDCARTGSLSQPSRWEAPMTLKPTVSRMQCENSKFSSVLANAAWSQLSQPPLEKLALNIVPYSEDKGMNRRTERDLKNEEDEIIRSLRTSKDDANSQTTFV